MDFISYITKFKENNIHADNLSYTKFPQFAKFITTSHNLPMAKIKSQKTCDVDTTKKLFSEVGKQHGKIKMKTHLYNDIKCLDYAYMNVKNGEMLDVLDSYGIKASFFLVGEQMLKSDRTQYVNDIYQRGHLVACHSFSHNFNTIYKSTSDFLSDIAKFENALKNILGEDIYATVGKYIRFPGGTNNSYIKKNQRMDFINVLRENGYKIYDWTLLTNDADDRYRLEGESDKDYYFRSIKEGIETNKGTGRPLILLMHDKISTKDALPEILDYLISEGYYFDTLNNCLEYTFVEN